MGPAREVPEILEDLRRGDTRAAAELLSVLYAELHGMARRQMRTERDDHTLQPTALVHEACLRLLGGGADSWENRAHFFGAAATAMRRILVEHARARRAARRKAPGVRLPLDDAQPTTDGPSLEVLAVHEALARLEAQDRRKARVVELRFFAGLEMDEIAAVLGTSLRTVEREWEYARAWMYREIGDAE